jgi:cytochrome c peroxidase
MHDGSLATLEDVVEFYSKGGRANPNLNPQLRAANFTNDEKTCSHRFPAVVERPCHRRSEVKIGARPPVSL